MDENSQIFKKYLKYLIWPKNGKIFKTRLKDLSPELAKRKKYR